jgi:hypothetical protein
VQKTRFVTNFVHLHFGGTELQRLRPEKNFRNTETEAVDQEDG